MPRYFPGVWRERRGRGESLSRGRGSRGQKYGPGLWPLQTFSRQEFAVLTETGSTADGDGFESYAGPLPAWLMQKFRGSASNSLL
jgi:hypothetical protein